MSLRIYDTLTQSKIELRPAGAEELGIYVCGLTVQNVPHIGHARAIASFDVVVRTLRARGYRVKFVRNITDVDDKIINRAKELGIEPGELVRRTIEQYHRDLDALGCLRPDVEPRVTEHIGEIVALIERLIAKEAAYARDGDVYFRVRSFVPYGKLSGRRIEDLRSGARVEVDERKDDPLDFALWKAAKPGEPQWPSPWGPGRPGWHIECSAMALKYLGAGFAIHGGGMDLIFPHHENEIAQSEAATGKEFARIWMHNGFLEINKEKMSKSLDNFVTVQEAVARYEPEAIRYYVIGTHYRGPLQLDLDVADDGTLRALPGIEEAERRLEYVYATLQRLDEILAALPAFANQAAALEIEIPDHRARFDAALDDDFNTAGALGHLAELLRFANELCDRRGGDKARLAATVTRVRADLVACCGCLGLLRDSPQAFLDRRRERGLKARGLDATAIERRIQDRAAARARKDFAHADAIRDALLEDGVEIRDSARGTTWRVLS